MRNAQIRAWLLSGELPPIAGGAGDTVTTYTNVLKEFYPAQGVVNQLNVDTYLLAKVEKAKRFTNVGGRYFYKPARMQLTGGVGTRGENVALPAAGNFVYDPIQIPIKFHYGVIQITGPLMAVSKTDKQAFAEALALTMDGMYEEFRLVANILLYGWGSAIIAQVLSVAGSVITLSDDIHPINWFYEGQNVDSYQSDEATVRQAGMGPITNVDMVNRKITVTTIGGTAATDRIVIAGSLNSAFQGLLGAVDDGTYVSTYFNISRTTRPKWKSYVDAGNNNVPLKYGNVAANRRAPSGDLVQKVLDQQQMRAGSGRKVDLLVSGLQVRRMFWNSLSPDRRFDSTVYDGGWEQIKFSNGDKTIPWHGTEFSPRYTIFGLTTETGVAEKGHKVDKVVDEELLAIYEAMPPEWDEATGSQLKQIYSSAQFLDAVGAFMRWYLNFGTCRPNVHCRIDDVSEG